MAAVSHDSEIAEVGRALKEHAKSQRALNLEAFEPWRERLMGLGLVQRSDYHWTVTIGGETCGWWPTTCKWHMGKTYHGTAEQFFNWLSRRHTRLMDLADRRPLQI